MGNFQELNQREQEGQLDEGFLSEVNAQLRNVRFLYWNCVNYLSPLSACKIRLPFFTTGFYFANIVCYIFPSS